MQQVKSVFLFSVLLIFLAACNEVDFKKTRSGIPYKVYEGKGTKKIEQGNFVKFHVIQKIGDSVLFDTRTAQPQYLQVTQPIPGYQIQNGLMEVFPGLKSGDSIQLVQALDSFVKYSPQLASDSLFRKGGQLVTGIRILDVFKSQAEYESDMEKESNTAFERNPRVQEQMKKDEQFIREYLTANNIEARKVGKGTYVQTVQAGTGPKAEKGKFVSVLYKGSLLNGKVFDSNLESGQPFTFKLGTGSTIPGFEEGIGEMSEGGRARIFIPSLLAYGPQAQGEAIPAFSNLIFELQLVKVSDEQPAGAAMPPGHSESDGHRH